MSKAGIGVLILGLVAMTAVAGVSADGQAGDGKGAPATKPAERAAVRNRGSARR